MNLKGKTLGNYKILKELGSGGMAVVYLAEDMNAPDANQVALKVLSPEMARRRDVVRRFQREMELYERLNHPGIVRALALEQVDDYLFLVLEYLEGGSLADRIQKQERLSWEEAVEINDRVAEALIYAHKQGVVHRDVKPSNILFDGEGAVLLTDFGVAHDIEATTITAVGVQPGTYHYMAPEQVKGRKLDGKADQFALATVFYQMISGHLPFSATDTFALAHQIANEAPALLPSDLDLPYGVSAVLSKAHNKDPQKRYPHIIAFADAMSELSFDTAPPIKPRKKARNWRWLMWATGAVLLLAVVLLGARFLAGRDDPSKSTPTVILNTPIVKTVAIASPSTPVDETEVILTSGGGLSMQEQVPTKIPTPRPTTPPTAKPVASSRSMPTLLPTQAKKQVTVPTSSPKRNTPTATPIPTRANHALHLLQPRHDETLQGRATFTWQADFALGPTEAFELVFWQPGKTAMSHGMSPSGASKNNEITINLDQVPFLSKGKWLWGVFLVQEQPFERIKFIGEERHFFFGADTGGASPFDSKPQ